MLNRIRWFNQTSQEYYEEDGLGTTREVTHPNKYIGHHVLDEDILDAYTIAQVHRNKKPLFLIDGPGISGELFENIEEAKIACENILEKEIDYLIAKLLDAKEGKKPYLTVKEVVEAAHKRAEEKSNEI